MTLGRELRAALMPARCLACDRWIPAQDNGAAPLCRRCLAALPWWRRVDGCPVCGAARPVGDDPADPGDAVCGGCLSRGSALHVSRALLRYEGPLRRWIPAYKRARGPFGPSPELAALFAFLAEELAARVAVEFSDRPDRVVAVPLHRWRRLRRGFNQADPLAYRIARRLQVEWAPRLLIRQRATQRQASLTGDARLRNPRGAFRVAGRLPRDVRIWLVDDVLTTGSTLEAAADALLEAGALEVRALTLAATLPAARRRIAAARPPPGRAQP